MLPLWGCHEGFVREEGLGGRGGCGHPTHIWGFAALVQAGAGEVLRLMGPEVPNEGWLIAIHSPPRLLWPRAEPPALVPQRHRRVQDEEAPAPGELSHPPARVPSRVIVTSSCVKSSA